jgi:methylated-DNA-[protein]-cysteine S-methyltransferase
MDTAGFLDRVAAAAVDEGAADVVYGSVLTPIGRLLVAQTESGICRVAFAEESEVAVLVELAGKVSPRVVASEQTVRPALDALAAYLEGEAGELDLPVDLRLVRSEFGLKVLSALRKVPKGEVTTYGRLADVIGHPRASRATGTALGRNPVPIIVPCHRVVPGTGGIGKYGGEPWRKQKLLELEGAL